MAAARLCESLGHHVAEASPAIDEEARNAAMRIIICAHTRATLELRGKALGREPRPEDVETSTWATAEYGLQVTASDYAKAIRVLHQAGRIVGRFFGTYDVLITPTMCRPPHKLGVLAQSGNDPQQYLEAILGTIAFTSPFNTTGSPAMSAPLSWSRDGLPIGVQFAADFGAEATLFRLAAQLEKAQPWAERRPALLLRRGRTSRHSSW
jgi:amidase/6-aminohexanoate-cyclic-dimer hydrolase